MIIIFTISSTGFLALLLFAACSLSIIGESISNIFNWFNAHVLELCVVSTIFCILSATIYWFCSKEGERRLSTAFSICTNIPMIPIFLFSVIAEVANYADGGFFWGLLAIIVSLFISIIGIIIIFSLAIFGMFGLSEIFDLFETSNKSKKSTSEGKNIARSFLACVLQIIVTAIAVV